MYFAHSNRRHQQQTDLIDDEIVDAMKFSIRKENELENINGGSK